MPDQVLAVVAAWLMALQPAVLATAAVDREFPVRGETSYSRYHHDYPATDIFASCGRRAVSPVDGVVLELSRRDRWDPETDLGEQRGGRFVSIKGRDGVRYYMSHFRAVRKVVRPGLRVRAGQHLARVGHSGSAAGTPCHVHLGLSPVCRGTGDWRIRRGVVRPYRFLRSWEDGGNRSPAAAVADWKREHGCS